MKNLPFTVFAVLVLAMLNRVASAQVQPLPSKLHAQISPVRKAVTPSYAVKQAKTAPVIDGKLIEWKEVPAITLDKIDQVRGGKWTGVNDASGTLRILWDQRGLYFALSVKDDHVNLPRAGEKDWDNDCCQFVFDSLLNGPSNSPQDQDRNFWQQGSQFSFDNQDLSFCATRGLRGPQLSQYRVRGSHAESYSVLPDKTIAFTASDGKYAYEWFLPWERLAPVSPSILGRCGFGFTINDKDGAAFKSALAWTPGAIYGLNASSLGEVVFEGAVGTMDEVLELPPEATAAGARGPSKWLDINGLAIQDTARLVISTPRSQSVTATVKVYQAGSDQLVASTASTQWINSATSPAVFSWDLSQLPSGTYEVVYENSLLTDSARRSSPRFAYQSDRAAPPLAVLNQTPAYVPPTTVSPPIAVPNPYQNYPYQRHRPSNIEVRVSFATLAVILAFVVILAIAFVPPGVRRALFGLGSSALVLVVAIVVVYFLLRTSQRHVATPVTGQPVRSEHLIDDSQIAQPMEAPRPAAPSPKVTKQVDSSPESNKPAWIDERPGRYGNSYIMTVDSGPWPTLEDSRQALNTAIKKGIGEYARKSPSLVSQAGDTARLIAKVETTNIVELVKSAEYIERVNTSLGRMYKIHARLEFNDQVHALLQNEWHEVQVADRIEYAGASALAVFFLLGGLYVYLKLGSSSRSSYNAELKSAAAVAILIAVAGMTLSGWGIMA